SPAAVEHQMEAISDACAFGLRQTLDVAEERAIADELAAIAGGPTPLSSVLQNLNRQATPGITAQSADRLRNHTPLGFRWNAGDMATTDWYPQGITGGSDVQANGRPE